MKIIPNVLRYFVISLSLCALSALQAAQISDHAKSNSSSNFFSRLFYRRSTQIEDHAKDYDIKDDEKADEVSHYPIKPISLQGLPYAQWANKKIVYSSMLSKKQTKEGNYTHDEKNDTRKKIEELLLKIKPSKEAVDITHYIVKVYADFPDLNEIQGQGTGTIINIEEDTVYLLTCAHNVVKHDPLNGKEHRAENVTFSYKEKKFSCANYIFHSTYNGYGIDLALIVSYSGNDLDFPYNFFPEVTSRLKNQYRGWVIGFPGEKEKKGELYGMSGNLEVNQNMCKHSLVVYKDIITSKGQSGSAIWAEFSSVYRIIGVHTDHLDIYRCNYGPFLSDELIKWINQYWNQIKEVNAGFLEAAKKGNLEELKTLKDKGANVKITDKDGNNALYYAVKYGAENNVIEWLINRVKVPIKLKEYDQTMTFLMAAKKGNLTTLKILKAKGTNVNATNNKGNNALHCATKVASNGEVIEWLIDTAHIPIESKGYYQKTPFLCAAKKGNLNTLRILKNKGANVKARDQNGNNALHYALEYRAEEDVIDWLINTAKVPIVLEEYDKTMTFLMAAKKGNLTTLKILKAKGTNLKAIDQDGNNALHLAVSFVSEEEVITWLIDSVGIPTESKNYYHGTPFLLAAEQGNLGILKFLKKKGVNLKAIDQDGNNALHLAAGFAPEGKGIEWLLDTAKIDIASKNNNKKTPFFCAAYTGNLEALKVLKNRGANVNVTDEDSNNALHYAIENDVKFEIIEWLVKHTEINLDAKGGCNQKTPFLCAAEKGNLEALNILKNSGVNVNATDEDGRNALHLAAMYAPEGKVIEWLIDTAKISIEVRSQTHKTPFMYAAQEGNLEALNILKNKGANLNATDNKGDNALHYAALYAPNGKGIEWLIGTAKIDIESKGQYQKTPFLCAAEKGNLEALKMLKNNGANLNATGKNGNNALHWSIWKNVDIECIKWLIGTAKIDIESKGEHQKTPFLCAAEKGNLEALKMLKNNGANLSVTDQYGNNALHLAAGYAPNGKGIEWLILTAKIDIESKNSNQKTPFLCAAEKGNLDALNMLKNKGANLKATDKDRDNALHWSAMYAPNDKSIQWLILTAKIDIESKNSNQKTPFLCAAEKGNLDALNMLKNKGANVKATDKDGDNALHFSALFAPNGKGIEWLIDSAKIDVESKGSYQKTPFLCAAKNGNLDALKMLKNKGANVHTKSQNGNNALHFAALAAPNGKGIEWLIDTAKIDIESKGYYQKTPFLCAAKNGNLDTLKLLKNKGANVKGKSKSGNNALYLAALYAPNGKGIEWLIDTAKIHIESKGQYQKTPFLCAAQNGNLEALNMLKNKGANLYATDQYGYNALHQAALFAPNGKGIAWLIDTAKIDIESKGWYQKTPFLCAAEKGNLEALKILKNKGANLYATSNTGNNALHYAALFAPNGKGIKWLILTAKIDIESKGYNQMTPFLCAAEKGNLEALKILKNKGANINATDGYGSNVLHYAALYAPNGKGIEWLIGTVHLSIESTNNYQKTPFLCAAEKGNLEALKILKNKGANLKATDKNGNNALVYAKKFSNSQETIDWLQEVCGLT